LFAISGSPPDAAAAIRAAAAFASIFPPEISSIRIRKIQTSLNQFKPVLTGSGKILTSLIRINKKLNQFCHY
jgi:hypothetical protein